MADIRKTSTLDDFGRADEDPLQAPWEVADTGMWPTTYFELVNSAGEGRIVPGGSGYPFSVNMYLSDAGPFDGDVEVWGATWDHPDLREGWVLYMEVDPGGSSALSGYALRATNEISGHKWAIRRYNGDGSWSYIAGPTSGDITDITHLLFRRLGDDLQGWYSTDDGANWTQRISVTDTTYTTDIYVGAGSQSDEGSGPGWKGFGGGVEVPWMPEFIRRPWEYHGGTLAR